MRRGIITAVLAIAAITLIFACARAMDGNTEITDEEGTDMLQVGDNAPDFEFTDLDGRTRRLTELLADGPVIVYFYPADFTGVCTRQACMFRDRSEDLSARGVQVVGVSPQDMESHGRFQREYELTFPLVADIDKAIVRAYGVNGPLGIGVRRVSFLVGQDGVIRNVVRADLSVGPHQALVDLVLEQSGFDQSVPSDSTE
jgi:thioredoxin-dependent peroxiredoxin